MLLICGQKVGQLMADRGLSQDELATKACKSKDTISKIVGARAGYECHAKTAKAVADALGVSVADIRVKNPKPEARARVELPQNPGSQHGNDVRVNTKPPDHVSEPASAERVGVLPYRTELPGALSLMRNFSKYHLARTAKQIDLLGLNLYVTWFNDTEFVRALTGRDAPPRLSILLPARDSQQLVLHDRKQAALCDDRGFFGHYDKTVELLKARSLCGSLRLIDEVVIHMGLARFDDLMFVMPYLAFRRGSNGPVLLIDRQESPQVFDVFHADFSQLWGQATPFPSN